MLLLLSRQLGFVGLLSTGADRGMWRHGDIATYLYEALSTRRPIRSVLGSPSKRLLTGYIRLPQVTANDRTGTSFAADRLSKANIVSYVT